MQNKGLMNITEFIHDLCHQLYLAPPLWILSWAKYYNLLLAILHTSHGIIYVQFFSANIFSACSC